MAIGTQEGSTSPGVEAGSSPGPAERLIAALVALALALGGVVFAIVTFHAGADLPPATATQENGLIALATGNPARISVVNDEGTNARQVTTGKEPDRRAEERGYFEESDPQWSPDGTKIAFVRWYDPGTSLCVIGLDGAGFRVLVPEFHGGQLAWSPDGGTIAYYGDEAIRLVDADGSNDRALAGLPSVPGDHPPTWMPTWSPDSTTIAFASKDLWTIRADGTDLTRITRFSEGQFAFDPSWSPDGSRILFSIGGWETSGGGGAQYGGTLYLVGPGGSNLSQLTVDGRFWWAADWSPDGRSIVSMRATPTASEDPYDWVDNGVYVMRSDGSDVRLLGEKLWGTPAWGPAPISSPSPTPRRAEASSVALPDGLNASRIAIGEGAVWALASTGRTGSSVLVRIDPSTSQVVATASLAPGAWFLAASADAAWIGFPGSSVIQRVDAATNEMTRQIQLPGDGIGAIAADDRAVWVEVIQDRSDQGRQNLALLVRIDPQTSQVVATIPLEGLSGYDDEIAIGAGDVWVAGVNLTGPSEERGAELVRIDPITNTVSARLPVSAFSVRAGADVTWVTSPADGVNDSLHKPEEWVARSIDPLSNEISPPTLLPGNASGVLGVTADGVWFSGYDAEGLIHPVRLQNDAFDASVPPIDAVYTDMALDGATGTIWIAATSALRRIDHG
jgi:dipeptidyl aminopeptidase/acylaminoacyl peptidase